MAEETEKSDHEKELSSKLLKRLGFAGIMVLLLLGVLAFFDFLASKRTEDPPLKVYPNKVPVAPRKEISQPVIPTEPVAETVPQGGEVTTVNTEQLPSAPSEAQTGEVEGSKPAESATKPIAPTAKAVVIHKPAASTKTHQEVKSVPEATAAPVIESLREAKQKPEEKAAQITRQAEPASSATVISLPRLFSGFVVQAGVFSNVRKAEELHATLAMNGVPSTMEARVQLGPFKTLKEAEVARQKLKELGIDALLIPPAKPRSKK